MHAEHRAGQSLLSECRILATQCAKLDVSTAADACFIKQLAHRPPHLKRSGAQADAGNAEDSKQRDGDETPGQPKADTVPVEPRVAVEYEQLACKRRGRASGCG